VTYLADDASLKQWRPRSTDEAAAFQEGFCDRCIRDEPYRAGTGDSCPIAAQGFGVALGLEPPHEWVDGDAGPICTAFAEGSA